MAFQTLSPRDAAKVRTFDNPILKQICTPVREGEKLPWLDDFARFARKCGAAAGLAAPQFGHARCVITVFLRLKQGHRWAVMINPVITAHSDDTEADVEGCLSYPGRAKAIARWRWIDVTYVDSTARGTRPQQLRLQDFNARVVQHEVDHLNGICRVGDDSPSALRSPVMRVSGVIAEV